MMIYLHINHKSSTDPTTYSKIFTKITTLYMIYLTGEQPSLNASNWKHVVLINQ